MRSFYINVIILLFIFLIGKSYAETIQVLNHGPIHEAYMTQEFGDIILITIPDSPPKELNEQIPPQTELDMQWIPGYWYWDMNINDYIWISGIWRKSPPHRIWIPGYWKHYKEGWVRINGFWSDTSATDLNYLEFTPPERLEEDMSNNQHGYFWMPGHWSFDQTQEKYIWFRGQWQPLDFNWVYVPSHYLWRPGGYVFVTGYWDWPLDSRGIVYKPVFIELSDRNDIVYTPNDIWQAQEILYSHIPYYPNFPNVYYHSYYFNFNLWMECDCTPPWWAWGGGWWSLIWDDQWALWWWYTHPGYPAPSWITEKYSSRIAPPTEKILSLFKDQVITPPAIITPNGVVQPAELIKAIKQHEGVNEKLIGAPILPLDKEVIEKIQLSILPKSNERLKQIRPSGNERPNQLIVQPPPKPHIEIENIEKESHAERVLVPNKPNEKASSTPQFFKNDRMLEQQLQEESDTFKGRNRNEDQSFNNQREPPQSPSINKNDGENDGAKPSGSLPNNQNRGVKPSRSVPNSGVKDKPQPSKKTSSVNLKPKNSVPYSQSLAQNQSSSTYSYQQQMTLPSQQMSPSDQTGQTQQTQPTNDPLKDPRLVIPRDLPAASNQKNQMSSQGIRGQNQSPYTYRNPDSNPNPYSYSVPYSYRYTPGPPQGINSLPPPGGPQFPSYNEVQPIHPLQNVTPSSKRPAYQRNSAQTPNSGLMYQPSQPKAPVSAPSSSGPGQHARIIIPQDLTSSSRHSTSSQTYIHSSTQGTTETPPQIEIDKTPPKPLPAPPISEYPLRQEPALPMAQQDLGRLMNSPQPQQNYGPSSQDSRGFRDGWSGY